MTIYSPFYNATNCNHKRLQGSFSRYKNPNHKRNYTSVNYEGYGRTCLFSWEEDKSFSTKNYMHQIASCWHCLYYNSTVDWAHKRPKRQKLRNCLGWNAKKPKIMLQTQNNMLYVQLQLTRHVQICLRIPSLPLWCQRSHPMDRSVNHYQHENCLRTQEWWIAQSLSTTTM